MNPNETVQACIQAERSNDASKLQQLLDDDFAAVGPRGFQLNKQQWVGRFPAGSYLNGSFDCDELDVREYGSTAIVRGVQTSSGTYDGQTVGGRFRGTQVYVQRPDGWKLAALQLSDMSGPMVEGKSQ
jgi:ketosteroid isomerase-like protein